MANALVIALSKHKETFKRARQFIYKKLGNDKEKLLKLEDASVSIIIPLYIEFLEENDVSVLEALNNMHYNIPSAGLWETLTATIVDTFRQIEQGNDKLDTPF
jgi:malate synthase